METNETGKSYFLQSNYFSRSILGDISEIQRDILYFLQHKIDFRSENPPDSIPFDYQEFLHLKKIKRRDAYTPEEVIEFAKSLVSLTGIIYNLKTVKIENFNIVDRVLVDPIVPENSTIVLAYWGKIFFYEKYAKEYAEKSNIQYTQLDKNIIDLKGAKRRILYELLSTYKSTGMYKVTLVELKCRLGFAVYEIDENETTPEQEREQKQLKLLFDQRDPITEVFKPWKMFKQAFLDPAVKEINERADLDIKNLSYATIKKGRKVYSLEFTFDKRISRDNLTAKERTAVRHLVEMGLTENQVMILIQRLGNVQNVLNRIDSYMHFNADKNNRLSANYGRHIWLDSSTGQEIKNVGGFLYKTVFPELQ